MARGGRWGKERWGPAHAPNPRPSRNGPCHPRPPVKQQRWDCPAGRPPRALRRPQGNGTSPRPASPPLQAADDVAVPARALGVQHAHGVQDRRARDAVDCADRRAGSWARVGAGWGTRQVWQMACGGSRCRPRVPGIAVCARPEAGLKSCGRRQSRLPMQTHAPPLSTHHHECRGRARPHRCCPQRSRPGRRGRGSRSGSRAGRCPGQRLERGRGRAAQTPRASHEGWHMARGNRGWPRAAKPSRVRSPWRVRCLPPQCWLNAPPPTVHAAAVQVAWAVVAVERQAQLVRAVLAPRACAAALHTREWA